MSAPCQHLYSLTSYTADLALQRLTLGNVIDYSLGVVPLAAGFLILPSLAGAAGREPAEAWELSLSLPTLLAHFTHSPDSVEQRRLWTCVTCGLCHPDAVSRAFSLRGLLLAGWQPATSFGALACLATFLSGTATAALNSHGRDLQVGRARPTLAPA